MRDLKSILDRCDEVGDCLVWTGRMNNKTPCVYTPDGYRQVRRLVYEEMGGVCIRSDRFPQMRCRELRCVKYEHIKLMTRSEIGKEGAKRGAYSSPQRRSAISAAMRKLAKIDQATARCIRTSTATHKAISAQYGISRSTVGRIRRNQTWREAARGASIFHL